MSQHSSAGNASAVLHLILDVIEIDVGDGGLKAEVVHTPKKA